MSDDLIFEGFTALYEEEDLQPITGDFSLDEAAAANLPDGIPDIWEKDFNDRNAQNALSELIKIQESEFRLDIGPVNEPNNPATPAPVFKGTPRFPGHLTISHTPGSPLLEMGNTSEVGAEAPWTGVAGQRGQLTPFPLLFSGGKLRRKSLSSHKQMGTYGESPLKRALFPTGEGATGSDEEETQLSYRDNQYASDDDAPVEEVAALTHHDRAKELTSTEEERLASLMSQVKLQEEKLMSLRDEVKHQEQTKAAVEEETERLKHENARIAAEVTDLEKQRAQENIRIAAEVAHIEQQRAQENTRIAMEAAHMETQRAKKETQDLLEEQARANLEHAKQAEEIRHIKARLQEAEAARIEANDELRALIKRTTADQDKEARQQAEAARVQEQIRIQTREEATIRRQAQELEDARIAARLQQEEEQLRYKERERVDHKRLVAKDPWDAENDYAEEDDDRMVARMGKELSELLGGVEANDEREMVEAEARQRAQAAAYEEQMAVYTKQTSEPAKQRARLQYAYDLVTEARARFERDPLKPIQPTRPQVPQADGYASRNDGSTHAWFQQATFTGDPHGHNAQPPAPVHSGDSLRYSQRRAPQQIPALVRSEGARLQSQNCVVITSHQKPLTSARQQTVMPSLEHHEIVGGQGYEPLLSSQPDTAPARHPEPLVTQPSTQTLAPSPLQDPVPPRQPTSAWVPQEQVQTSGAYVSAHAEQRIPAAARTAISGAEQNLQALTPSTPSYLSVSSTASDVSYVSSNTETQDNIRDGDLMPPYDVESKSVRFGNGLRAYWSVSEAPYPLLPAHIHVEDAESGHLHFHTDTLHSRSIVWMLNPSGSWDNVTKQWRTDWGLDSEKEMLKHPRYDDLVLTVAPNNKPNWILFSTFKGKIKNGTAKKPKTTPGGLVLFPLAS